MLPLQGHPSDDAIELYALGRLPEESVARLEEHLLVCTRCQDALRKEDAFAQGIRSLKSNSTPSS